LRRSNSFVEAVVARLMPLGEARARAMFGGWGIYLDAVMIGLVAGDRLYLKTDAANWRDFETAGMGPFTYLGAMGRVTTSYWEAPPELLAQPDRLHAWAAQALAAAQRSRAAKQSRRARARTAALG
jgi:DNA transformation protein